MWKDEIYNSDAQDKEQQQENFLYTCDVLTGKKCNGNHYYG